VSRFKEARERANMTQEELADAVGTSKSYIWQIETGRREPRVTFALKLAEAVGATVETMFDTETSYHDSKD
jgi:putative transcriptional regulator